MLAARTDGSDGWPVTPGTCAKVLDHLVTLEDSAALVTACLEAAARAMAAAEPGQALGRVRGQTLTAMVAAGAGGLGGTARTALAQAVRAAAEAVPEGDGAAARIAAQLVRQAWQSIGAQGDAQVVADLTGAAGHLAGVHGVAVARVTLRLIERAKAAGSGDA